MPPAACDNTCPGYPDFAHDGACDDGGAGSEYSHCGKFGSDCADCGPRHFPPPSPPLPPRVPKCDVFVDIVLVLDKSGSMWNFRDALKTFTTDLLETFGTRHAAAQALTQPPFLTG